MHLKILTATLIYNVENLEITQILKSRGMFKNYSIPFNRILFKRNISHITPKMNNEIM